MVMTRMAASRPTDDRSIGGREASPNVATKRLTRRITQTPTPSQTNSQ